MDFQFLAQFVQAARWVLPMVPMVALLVMLYLVFVGLAQR